MARRAGVLLLVLLVATAADAAEPVAETAPFRVCGDDHDYSFRPPPGWKPAADDSDARAVRSFTPKGATLDADGAMLTLGRRYQDVGVDFDEAFELGVAARAIQDTPSEIRSAKLKHPEYASHAALFEYASKQVHTVLVDPGSGGGLLLELTLTRVGEKASPELLAQLEAALASLRFDAGRVCKRGPDGAVHEQAVLRPAPPPAAPKAAPTPRERALRRATAVCSYLQRLELRVRCEPGLLRGEPVMLASFDAYEGRSAQQFMDAFRPPIARVYCWVAGEQELPKLAFFAVRDSGGTNPVITWSCALSHPDVAVPFEDFRPDRGVSQARAAP